MTLRIDKMPLPKTSSLLRHCFLYVSREWQHLARDDSPDQGFERRFRESCVEKLDGWVVSQHREMCFGLGLMTASGVLHEIDLVAQGDPVIGILELKNRPAWAPEKNDVIVFFAKLLDYLTLTPALLQSTIVPVFMSSHGFEESGLAACLGLGIHPVTPFIRPLPVLINNALCMLAERGKGVILSEKDEDAIDDFCSNLSRMASILAGSEMNSRFRYMNESSVEVNAFGGGHVYEMANELRRLNGESSRLVGALHAVRGD